MMKKLYTLKYLLVVFVNVFVFDANMHSQSIKKLNLKQVIDIAQEQSLNAFINKNMYLSSYWEYRSYKAEKRPWLSLSSAPLVYNNNIQPDLDTLGNQVYKRTNNISSSGGLSISQNIFVTGGEISINSGLSRIENLAGKSSGSFYSTTPISLGFKQPLFQYNQYKWNKKIEPIKFEKAKREYIQSVEEVAWQAVQYFFNLLDAQQARDIAYLNKATADTFYQKSLGRYELGAMAQKDLQRLELNMVNSELTYQSSELNLERVKFKLKSFLRLPEDEEIELILPSNFPTLKIKAADALTKAIENNPDILIFEQRLIEADQEIARIKGQTGIQSSMNVNFGLSNSASAIDDAYINLAKDRNVELGLYIPIVDWGLSKGQREMAKFNKEIVSARVEQERIDFEQDILMSTIEYNMMESQLNSRKKAKDIAEKTYKTIRERFLLGKENIETLYASRNERDSSRRNYYNKMREYWLYYYWLRSLTLYDFENDQSLSENFDALFGL